MKVFVVTTQKGGAGKTTICSHLGVELSRRGYLVVLVDTDPHAGLTDWWNDRVADEPALLSVAFAELGPALELLRESGVDFVVIDTPPQVNDRIGEIVALADLVVIPSKASRNDLRATRKTLDLVEASQKTMVFVLNEVRPKTRIEGEAILALAQHGKLAPVVHYRQDIVTGMIDGRTIQEISPGSTGANEVKGLCDYLLKQVGIEVPKQVAKQSRKRPITQVSKYAVAQSGDKK